LSHATRWLQSNTVFELLSVFSCKNQDSQSNIIQIPDSISLLLSCHSFKTQKVTIRNILPLCLIVTTTSLPYSVKKNKTFWRTLVSIQLWTWNKKRLKRLMPLRVIWSRPLNNSPWNNSLMPQLLYPAGFSHLKS
jgi:hypothetical protein